MKLLVETELDITVRTFYKEFLSDDVSLTHTWMFACCCCAKMAAVHPIYAASFPLLQGDHEETVDQTWILSNRLPR